MAKPPAYFFGYGSLVNRDTHSFGGAEPAKLQGWRRAWRHTSLRDVVFLTAVPAPNECIDGLIAPVPDQDWAALDDREFAYERLPAAHQVTHKGPATRDIALYAIPEGRDQAPMGKHVVLLSYLDVVVQGYLREFGEDGVTRFFDTTDGWEAPILNDRPTPRYPRHCALTKDETQLVDHNLNRLSAKII